jgi:hypothetical protein
MHRVAGDRTLRRSWSLVSAAGTDLGSRHEFGHCSRVFSHLALIEAAGRIIVQERLDELS